MGRLTSRSVQGAMLGAFYGFTLLGMFPLPEAWQLAFAGYAVVACAGFVVSLARVKETRTVPPAAIPPGTTVGAVVGGNLYRLFAIVILSGFATTLIEPICRIGSICRHSGSPMPSSRPASCLPCCPTTRAGWWTATGGAGS